MGGRRGGGEEARKKDICMLLFSLSLAATVCSGGDAMLSKCNLCFSIYVIMSISCPRESHGALGHLDFNSFSLAQHTLLQHQGSLGERNVVCKFGNCYSCSIFALCPASLLQS